MVENTLIGSFTIVWMWSKICLLSTVFLYMLYLQKLSLLHVFMINHSFKLELPSFKESFYSGLPDVL